MGVGDVSRDVERTRKHFFAFFFPSQGGTFLRMWQDRLSFLYMMYTSIYLQIYVHHAVMWFPEMALVSGFDRVVVDLPPIEVPLLKVQYLIPGTPYLCGSEITLRAPFPPSRW